MLKKIIAEKIFIYICVMVIGLVAMYGVHIWEIGYDKDGVHVEGYIEKAERLKKDYIEHIQGLGFTFDGKTADNVYMTFKKDGQFASVATIKATLDGGTLNIDNYICDLYFKDSTDIDSMQVMVQSFVPGLNLSTEFIMPKLIEEFNSTHQIVESNGITTNIRLTPIEGFEGVVLHIEKK